MAQLAALGRPGSSSGQPVLADQVARGLGRGLTGLLGRTVTLDVVAEPACGVHAERAQLELVLLHLIIAARDDLPRGGTVQVVVRGAGPADLAELDLPAATRPMIALEVSATPDRRDVGPASRALAASGTAEHAPDLAAVVAVVHQCDGVAAIDRPRRIVLVPRRAIEAARPRLVTPAATGAEVLVVEDSEAIRRLASRLLARAGYRVAVAVDGVAALELIAARAAPFELVLTDLNMPRMGGLELARRLAELQPRARVLFMTGYSEELAAVSTQAPTIACLAKPFTPAELLGHVAGELAVDRGHARSA